MCQWLVGEWPSLAGKSLFNCVAQQHKLMPHGWSELSTSFNLNGKIASFSLFGRAAMSKDDDDVRLKQLKFNLPKGFTWFNCHLQFTFKRLMAAEIYPNERWEGARGKVGDLNLKWCWWRWCENNNEKLRKWKWRKKIHLWDVLKGYTLEG